MQNNGYICFTLLWLVLPQRAYLRTRVPYSIPTCLNNDRVRHGNTFNSLVARGNIWGVGRNVFLQVDENIIILQKAYRSKDYISTMSY